MINDSEIIENSADDEYDMNIFIHDTKKKRYTYICSECNSINHKISISGICSAYLSCDTLTKEEKRDILYENSNFNFDSLKLKCPKCNKKTWHYALDENIVDIVKALNDKGYATQYSCEGHYNDEGCTLSYFVIIGDVRDKFDLENPLISNWNCEYSLALGERTILRIDPNKISMGDFIEQKHLDNMLCYIEDYM